MNSSPRKKPALSVVIVRISPDAALEQCLAALRPQVDGSDEIIVVQREPAACRKSAEVRLRHPDVRWIIAPADTTVPRMRGLGMEASRGEIIALLEDDCVVGQTWRAAVVGEHQRGAGVAGGPVQPGNYANSLDWAVYFCEYGRFMHPQEPVASALPGNNVSYRRDVVEKLSGRKELQTDGFYDVFAHRQLQQSGHSLRSVPGMSVVNVHSWGWPHVLRVPFHHGRGFAGMRVATAPWMKRGMLGVLSLLLPVVITGRVIREVVRRSRYIPQLLLSLPYVLLFAGSWSAGELTGYLVGAGRSLEEWR